MAPEMYTGQQYGLKVDVWAMGMCVTVSGCGECLDYLCGILRWGYFETHDCRARHMRRAHVQHDRVCGLHHALRVASIPGIYCPLAHFFSSTRQRLIQRII